MKFIKSFLIILAPIIIGFLGGRIVLDCLWVLGTESGNNFGCRVISPSLLMSLVILFVSGVFIIKGLHKTGSFFFNKIALSSFIIVFLIPLILIAVYSLVTPPQALKYLEGITTQSCATGRPSVPWGKSINSDECYFYLGECENISNDQTAESCFFKNRTFSQYQDCDVFTRYTMKIGCQMGVATQKQDLNFCSSIDALLPNDRHDCVMVVLGLSNTVRNITAVPGVFVEKINKCKTLGGIRTDVCLSDMAKLMEIDTCSDISSEIPWFKKNCQNMY